MKASGWFAGLTGTVLVVALSARLPAQGVQLLPPDPQPAVAQVSYEVATRGPLHEAFAKPFSSDPIPGVTIDVAPPEPIEELPPEVAPDGDNVAWVPGYWGWEPDRATFIWISGIWRNAPPGQQWVPGYWTEVDGQYQWVSGFWTTEQTEALVYLPYPPETLEEGPVSAAPAEDFFWVPGTWLWVGNEYQWQPGYWSRAYAEWVWNPSEYVWTPYGCIYTAGYWDHRPTDRGIVFAPVYIRPALARTTTVRYTPSVIVQVPRTFVHWFVSPRYQHYYFGNYYGGTYAQVNLVPWYTYHGQRGYHDPLLNYYRWHYARQNVDFIDRLAGWHRYYSFYEDRRPPVTFAQQRQFFSRRGEDSTAGHFRLAQSIEETVEGREAQGRFRRLERERRQELARATETLREVQRLRNRVERMAVQRPGERPGVADRDPVRRVELPDRARRGLRVDRDRDERRTGPDLADRRRTDGRDERPRSPDFARDRNRDRDRFEGPRRAAEREGERVRTARPITPGPEGDDLRRGQPPRRGPQEAEDRRPGREEREAAPSLERRPDRPPSPQSQRAEQPGRVTREGRPGQGPAGRPADAVRPGPDRPGEDAAGRQVAPRRGQARGFDGRNLPVPERIRPDRRREDAARGPSRGRGPLGEQPAEIERDDPRARGPARAERARDAARQAQPRPQPGRGPAAERPDRDDRRGPPQRATRGRPNREDDDQPRRQPRAEEPDDDEPDDEESDD